MVDSKKLYWAILQEKFRVIRKNWFGVLLVFVFILISVDTVWYKSELNHGTIIELVNNETLTGTKKVALVHLSNGDKVKVELPKGVVLGVNSKISVLLKQSKISRRSNYELVDLNTSN